MPIVVNCRGCKTRLTLGEDRAGTTFDCPRCAAPVVVPAVGAAPAPPVPQPQPSPPPKPTPAEPAKTVARAPAFLPRTGNRGSRRTRGRLVLVVVLLVGVIATSLLAAYWSRNRVQSGASARNPTQTDRPDSSGTPPLPAGRTDSSGHAPAPVPPASLSPAAVAPMPVPPVPVPPALPPPAPLLPAPPDASGDGPNWTHREMLDYLRGRGLEVQMFPFMSGVVYVLTASADEARDLSINFSDLYNAGALDGIPSAVVCDKMPSARIASETAGRRERGAFSWGRWYFRGNDETLKLMRHALTERTVPTDGSLDLSYEDVIGRLKGKGLAMKMKPVPGGREGRLFILTDSDDDAALAERLYEGTKLPPAVDPEKARGLRLRTLLCVKTKYAVFAKAAAGEYAVGLGPILGDSVQSSFAWERFAFTAKKLPIEMSLECELGPVLGHVRKALTDPAWVRPAPVGPAPPAPLDEKEKKLLERLVKDLEGKVEKDQLAALDELEKMGTRAKPVLKSICDLLVASPKLTKPILIAVEKIAPELHGPLTDYLLDANANVRSRAIHELSKLGDKAHPVSLLLMTRLQAAVQNVGRLNIPVNVLQDVYLFDAIEAIRPANDNTILKMKDIATNTSMIHSTYRIRAAVYLTKWADTDPDRRKQLLPLLPALWELKLSDEKTIIDAATQAIKSIE